jgi:hypothetical protein
MMAIEPLPKLGKLSLIWHLRDLDILFARILVSIIFSFMMRANKNLAINTTLKAHLSGNKRCAEIAQAIGISQFMTLSPRSDPHSTKTLNKAINALIGAVYVDSDCNKTTLLVLENLNWFSPSKEVTRPLTVHNRVLQYRATSDMPVAVEETVINQVNTLSCPQKMPAQDIHSRLASLESETGLHLQIIFRNIASPSTLAMLRSQVYCVLHAEHVDCHPPRTDLSAFERYTVIQRLGQKISYLHTIRNNHILQLYQQCGGNELSPYVNIIQFNYGTKKAGNPLHRQDTEITLRMMLSIFPGSKPDRLSGTFNEVKQLRRVGKRLSTLVQHFGIGILGLMHNSEAVTRGTDLAYLLFVQRLLSQVDHD